MRTVRVNKEELTQIVAENRDKHRVLFEEALEGWYKAAQEELARLLDLAKTNKINKCYVSLPRPEDHTEDYDLTLQMLSMSVDDVIELTEQEFSWFVQDDWGWKHQWTLSNSAYSETIADTMRA